MGSGDGDAGGRAREEDAEGGGVGGQGGGHFFLNGVWLAALFLFSPASAASQADGGFGAVGMVCVCAWKGNR